MDVSDILAPTNPLKAMNDAFGKSYAQYAKKAAENSKATEKKKGKGPKKTGFVRATGRDSVERLKRMLLRLDAKFREVNESDVDSKLKEVYLMDIRREMNNLEGLIREIQQKEIRRAAEKSKEEHEKRKRKTESKSLLIKRGYLHSIEDGGFDPADYEIKIGGDGGLSGGISPGASVELSTGDVSMAVDAAPAAADMDLSV